MNELTVTVLRLGLLVLLWGFVFSIISVLRTDLYGTKVLPRGGNRSRNQSRAPKSLKRGPTHVAVIEGGLKGTTLPLSDAGLLIGRNPECSLVLGDDFASGRHARIYRRDDGWYADDLGSTNGTFVGQERIGEAYKLDVGTRLRIGQTVLELRK